MTSPGQLLAGRYRVVRRLGAGGAAAVLLAEDELLERKVAVKVLHPSAGSATGRRIQREARLGATLAHPNLVTVFDVVVEDDVLLLVMEYVPGETLAERLERGPLAPAEAIAVLRPVADALDHVHAVGIVHRDVKPANVLLRADGPTRVKLADLGIAAAEDVSAITQTGGVLGTLAYVAPEQLEPGPPSPAVDVYALAAVAFETVSGRRARRGSTTMELFAAATNAPPPDLLEVRPDLPPAAADVLRRGMATDPADRPHLARALVDELEAALRPPRPAPVPAPPPPAAEPAPPRALASSPAPAPRRVVPARSPQDDRDTAPARLATPAPPPPPARAAAPRRRRSRAVLLAPLALALVVLGVGAALLAGGGGDDPAPRAGTVTGGADTAPATGGAPGTGTDPGATAPPGTSTAEDPPAAATAGADDGSPARAVRAFYERAAEDDLDGAWALASPSLRAQLGPRATFDGTFTTLEAIEFPRLEVTDRSGDAATVALETVATHTTFTDRCSGTAQAARTDGGRWRVGRLGVQCTRG